MCSGYSRARIVRANLLVLHGLADASLAAIARKLKAARAFSVQVLTSILRGGNYVLMRKLCVLNTLLNETDVVIPNTLLSLGLSLAVSFKKINLWQNLKQDRCIAAYPIICKEPSFTWLDLALEHCPLNIDTLLSGQLSPQLPTWWDQVARFRTCPIPPGQTTCMHYWASYIMMTMYSCS